MKIEAEQLSYSIGNKKILENISIHLEKKELVMLLGANGAGKTTLIRLLCGFIRPDRGKICYNEEELFQIPVKERAKLVSYMPQRHSFENGETVFEFILTGMTPYLSLFKVPGRKEKKAVEEVLESFGISVLSNRLLSALSGGERQLVYFARARVQRSAWMLLDEPLASLDYEKQHSFMEKLKDCHKESQQGLLMSVHDPDFALRYADRVILLGQGRIQAVIAKEAPGFEQTFTIELNRMYHNHLELIEHNKEYFFIWKEKADADD